MANERYLLVDTAYVCGEAGGWQQTAALGIGMPTILLVIVGAPLSLMYYLHKNLRRFDDIDFSLQWAFVYAHSRLTNCCTCDN